MNRIVSRACAVLLAVPLWVLAGLLRICSDVIFAVCVALDAVADYVGKRGNSLLAPSDTDSPREPAPARTGLEATAGWDRL